MTECIVGSENPVKINAAQVALAKVLNKSITITPMAVSSGVADQPLSQEDTRQGAINRINACVNNVSQSRREHSWFVAIEGGVDHFVDGPATFAYVAIYHQGIWSVNHGASLPLPGIIYQALEEGRELGDVMDDVFATNNVKQKEGAIGLLTNNLATRQSIYESVLILALAKFNHPQLYGGI